MLNDARTWVATTQDVGVEHDYLEFPDVRYGPIIEVAVPTIFACFNANCR